MKIRREQIEVLSQAHLEDFRAGQLENFRAQGYKADEDPQTREIILEDAAGGTSRIAYGAHTVAVTTREDYRITAEHDRAGKLVALTDAAGTRFDFAEDEQARTLTIRRGGHSSYRMDFNERRDLTAAHYPDGTSTRLAYDNEGRLIFITDRNGHRTRYGYSAAGVMTRRIDAAGNITRFDFDDAGDFAGIVYADGSRHDFEFDEQDNLSRMLVNGREHAKFHIVEEAGLYEVEYEGGAKARFVTSGDVVTEAVNETCTVRLSYDERGKLIREETDGQVVEFVRNEVGGLVGIVTPDGERLTFERDGDQSLRRITDWAGGQYAFQYSKVGALARLDYPNGATISQTATQMGLTESLNLISPMSFGSLINQRWEHDVCDRVARMSDGKLVRRYRYDDEGRLLSVDCSDPDLSESFELDANGNRTSDNAGACEFNNLNQLVRRGETIYSYEERGNMTGGATPKGRARFVYNGRDQLVSVEVAGIRTTYAYDAFGRRVRKECEGRVTRYVWAGTCLLSETTTQGTKTTRRDYLFHPDRPHPLAIREDGEIFYLHAGRLGEPLCMTSKLGDVVWQADYNAFGQARVSVNKVSQPFRLAGQYFDEETGLHYALARYYNAELGRYLTPDPMRVEGGSLNFYVYCDGDPINRLDPTGEFIIPAILIAVAVGALIGAAIGAAIGAGVEAYKQYKTDGKVSDWGKVGKAAAIGGAVGAIGGAVGGLFPPAGATIAATLGLGAVAGGVSSGVEYCAEKAITGEKLSGKEFAASVLIGAGVGAVTAGIGGLIAAKLARRAARKAAQEAAEEAAREAEQKAIREAEQQALREAEERAAREAEERAAREAEQKAAKEAEEKAAKEAGRTKPSGAKGGKPGGKRTKIGPKDDDATKRSLLRENEAADKLSDAGYNVEQNPMGQSKKNPDYKLEGNYADCYSPSTNNARNIMDNVSGKVGSGQADRVVLNLADSDVPLDALRSQLAESPIENLKELIVLTKDGSIMHLFP